MLWFMLGWQAAAGVDWARLFHAYGPAIDTPAHLRALVGDDLAGQGVALDHLDSAVLHQGTVYSVTPVAVRVVAGLLHEPALRHAGHPVDQLLPEVLAFLGRAADSAAADRIGSVEPPLDTAEADSFYPRLADGGEEAWESPLVGALMRRAVIDLRGSAPELIEAVVEFMDDPELAVRIDAVGALAQMGVLSSAAPLAADLVRQLRMRLDAVDGREEKANLVMTVGRLGAETSPWLQDSDPAVRALAALTTRDDPRSTTILIEALSRPNEVDAWFPGRLPLIEGRTRFTLLHELLARDIPFASLLPAALAIAEVAGGYTASSDWGPLLQAAFPEVTFVPGMSPPAPAQLDDAQRAFLRALVANESLWDPTNGNAMLARMRVGIPDERSAVAKLAR
jgi:hypothetical protein